MAIRTCATEEELVFAGWALLVKPGSGGDWAVVLNTSDRVVTMPTSNTVTVVVLRSKLVAFLSMGYSEKDTPKRSKLTSGVSFR